MIVPCVRYLNGRGIGCGSGITPSDVGWDWLFHPFRSSIWWLVSRLLSYRKLWPKNWFCLRVLAKLQGKNSGPYGGGNATSLTSGPHRFSCVNTLKRRFRHTSRVQGGSIGCGRLVEVWVFPWSGSHLIMFYPKRPRMPMIGHIKPDWKEDGSP